MINAANRLRNSKAQMVPVGDFKRAGGFSGVRGLIVQMGGNPEDVLQRFGISPASLDDPDNYVSYSAMARVMEYCAERLDQPHFGFELAKIQSPDATGQLAALLLAAPTVGEGITLVTRYMAVLAPGAKLTLEIEANEAQLSYQISASPVRFCRQVNEFSLALVYKTLRSIVDSSFHLNDVELGCAPPQSTRNSLDQFFGTTVRYDATISNIRFPLEYLARRIDTGNPTLLRFAQAQCEALITHDRQIEDEIALQIRQLLPLGAANLPAVAQRLMVHPRSLQNRLSSLGIEFREILRRERQSLAEAYLTEMRTPISEVAFLLGYSDQATFTRAFTKWVGQSPNRYRRKMTVGDYLATG